MNSGVLKNSFYRLTLSHWYHYFPHNIVFSAIKNIGGAVFLERSLLCWLWGLFSKRLTFILRFWDASRGSDKFLISILWLTMIMKYIPISEMLIRRIMYVLELKKYSNQSSTAKWWLPFVEQWELLYCWKCKLVWLLWKTMWHYLVFFWIFPLENPILAVWFRRSVQVAYSSILCSIPKQETTQC